MSKQHKVRLSLLTIILAFILVGSIGIAAVTKTNVGSVEPTDITYYYNGPSDDLESEVLDPGNWDTTQGEDFTCGANTPIPCSLLLPENSDIVQYLEDLGTLLAVQTAAPSRRQSN